VPGHVARFVPKTGVKGGLSATGLAFWKFDVHAEPFEHVDDALADLGSELIDKAGHEKLDALWSGGLNGSAGLA
jgi:hypothetical protein